MSALKASAHTHPDVLLLIATGCSICPIVHKILTRLKEEGRLNKLEVINISQHPEQALQLGVRSVPWFRIGDLEFQGLHSASELEYWSINANSEEGIKKYIIEELETGHLTGVQKLLNRHPGWLPLCLSIVSDMQSPIQARIGLGAVFEDLQGQEPLIALVPALVELTRHSDARVRGDACYYLGLSGDAGAKPTLQHCTHDPDNEVREIAREALDSLAAGSNIKSLQ